MGLKNTALLYDPVTIQAGVRRLVPATTRRILDLGGGRGGNGAVVKQQTGAEFLCLADLSDAALREAAPGVDATMTCDIETAGSIESVFAAHGPFDLVLLLDVLEHLYDPWRIIARLHALLGHGSHLLSSIPNIQNYRTIIRAATGSWRYRDTGMFDRTHLRFFGKRSAIDLMTCTGLTLVDQAKGFGPKARDRLADRLSLGLLGPFVTMQHQILVSKTSETIIDPGFCGSAGPTA
ncbi:MAG TPA: methyltransferase domain-containing protein [Sphingobium sp.]|nr:methyltransferase domain-containing protein [Sphingobium sp.]